MASKIQGRDFDAPIKPYVFNGQEYNTLRVHIDYQGGYAYGGHFDATLTPEKIERREGGFVVRGFCITGTRDPLGSWFTVELNQAPRNSSRHIDKMYENLTAEGRPADIAELFDRRNWDTLAAYIKEVALTGTYSGAPIKETSTQTINQTINNPKQNESTMETKNVNNMKAADLIGKTIVVGEGVATIAIIAAIDGVLQGVFKKDGQPEMHIPITMENLRTQVEGGTWKVEGGTEQPVGKATGTMESEAGAVEEPIESEAGTEEEPDEDAVGEIVDVEPDGKTDDDPVLLQWREAKTKSPEAVILFRSGTVYVALMEDATKVAEVTGKELTKEGSVMMVVFPDSDFGSVMTALVSAKVRVAVADLQQPEASGETTEEPVEEPVGDTTGTVESKEPTAEDEVEEVEDDGEQGRVEETAKPRVKPRVQPKGRPVEQPAEEPVGKATGTAEEPIEVGNGTEAGKAADTKPKTKVKPNGAEVTAEAEDGTPKIVKVSEKSIIVTGDTARIEAVLTTLWGRRRPYVSKGKTYSGIQLSARHKETVKEIIKLAYEAA